jgi:hypothetical protein
MVEPTDEGAADTAMAEQLFEDGVDALKEGEYVESSDLLSQCLQMKAARFGDESLEAALVCVKYGASLLGCARAAGVSVLRGMDKVQFSQLVCLARSRRSALTIVWPSLLCASCEV